MQAIVLVGGEGTRLRPLTDDVPKPALTLVDRPFLAYMVEWLAGHGVTEVVLACGFLPDVLREALGEGERGGRRASRYVAEPEPLRHRRGDPLRRRRARRRPRRALPGPQRRRPHRPRPDRAAARPRGARGAGDDRPATRSRTPPPTAWSAATTSGAVLEFLEKTGEAVPGRGQRRRLRARALGARPDPAGARGLDRARGLPAAGRRRPARPAARRLLDGHRHPRALPAGELGHPRGAGRDAGRADRAGPAASAPSAEVADGRDGRPARRGLAGCRVGAGAEVRDSVLLDGCTVGEGARVERLDPRRRASRSTPGAELDGRGGRPG